MLSYSDLSRSVLSRLTVTPCRPARALYSPFNTPDIHTFLYTSQLKWRHAPSEHFSAPVNKLAIRTFSESPRPPRSQHVRQFANSHALFVPRQATLRTCGTVVNERAAPWAGIPLPARGLLHRNCPQLALRRTLGRAPLADAVPHLRNILDTV